MSIRSRSQPVFNLTKNSSSARSSTLLAHRFKAERPKMATTDSDPLSNGQAAALGSDKPKAWYIPDSELNESSRYLTSEARSVFESYSGIASDEVLPHIRRVRAAAFAVCPYPCIGELRFLDFSISRLPSYRHILSILTSSSSASTDSGSEPALLDIGCCVGQDLRRLAHDGVPSSRLVGLELEERFVDLGWELFRDSGRFEGKFVVGDALNGDENPQLYDSLRGHFDVVHAASFLHLFNWQNQVRMGVRIVGLLKPQGTSAGNGTGTGTMVVGRQVGDTNPGEKRGRVSNAEGDETKYRHDRDTFQKLWDEIGRKTDTKWNVDATLVPLHDADEDSTVRFMTFEVTRIE